MIEYKAVWHKRKVVKVNRFYPSSKMCSCCKEINHDLKLSDREWECPSCHVILDRDENACINLYNYEENLKILEEINKKKINNKLSKKVKKFAGLEKNQYTVGTTDSACGDDVIPEVSKQNIAKKSRAVVSETRIPVL